MFAAVFVLIGVVPWLFGKGPQLWALGLAAVFAAAALLLPSVLAPLNRVWTLLGLLLHKVMSPVTLAVMFYLLITPMGVVMRWLGKDPLRLRFDPKQPSYWLEREPPGPKADTFTNQF